MPKLHGLVKLPAVLLILDECGEWFSTSFRMQLKKPFLVSCSDIYKRLYDVRQVKDLCLRNSYPE